MKTETTAPDLLERQLRGSLALGLVREMLELMDRGGGALDQEWVRRARDIAAWEAEAETKETP